MGRPVTGDRDTRSTRPLGRRLRVTGAAVPSLAPAACAQLPGGQPGPAPAPPAVVGSSSTSGEVDHSVEPAQPAAMAGADGAGAQAAVEYALALVPYASTTGDLSAWQALSHEDCRFCQQVVEDVRALHDNDGRHAGETFGIRTVEVFEPTPGHDYFAVDLTAEQRPTREFGPADDLVAETPTRYALMFAAVAWTDDGWQLREITVNEVDEARAAQ